MLFRANAAVFYVINNAYIKRYSHQQGGLYAFLGKDYFVFFRCVKNFFLHYFKAISNLRADFGRLIIYIFSLPLSIVWLLRIKVLSVLAKPLLKEVFLFLVMNVAWGRASGKP